MKWAQLLIFGGEKEITVSSMGADPRVAGVISDNQHT